MMPIEVVITCHVEVSIFDVLSSQTTSRVSRQPCFSTAHGALELALWSFLHSKFPNMQVLPGFDGDTVTIGVMLTATISLHQAILVFHCKVDAK